MTSTMVDCWMVAIVRIQAKSTEYEKVGSPQNEGVAYLVWQSFEVVVQGPLFINPRPAANSEKSLATIIVALENLSLLIN